MKKTQYKMSKFILHTTLGVMTLALFISVAGCKKGDVISTVVTVNVEEQYVVIAAGRDKGIRVGDVYELSRPDAASTNVKVFEVADTTSNARGVFSPYLERNLKIDRVLVGDKAWFTGISGPSKGTASLLHAIVIGFALGFLSLCWFGEWQTWSYLKNRKFLGSKILTGIAWCLRLWFWFLFLGSAYLIAHTSYIALYVDGLYLQGLLSLYFVITAAMSITFFVTWTLIGLTYKIKRIGPTPKDHS